MSDKLIRLFAGFIVGILVARYLGPENFGMVAYATSIATLFAMFNHLGLDGLSVRYFVENQDLESESKITATVFGLKFIASFVAILLMIGFAAMTSAEDEQMFVLLIIFSLAIIFQPFNVLDFYFQAKVKGKYSSLAKSFSICSASIMRLILVLLAVSPLWFGIAYVIEAFALAVALIYFYYASAKKRITFSDFDKPLAKNMMAWGWMVMFGAIFATVYKKIDQAMLMWMVGKEEVGVYAVAAQLSDVWSFVPLAIAASLFPKLIELKARDEKAYARRLQNIFDLLFLMGLILAVVTSLIAEQLVVFLFTESYAASAPVLIIHIWSCVFVFMRALFSKWIHIEQVFIFSMVTQGLGALTNILINYFVIPEYGAIGAAYATLFSYSMAAYFSLLFTKKTRLIFVMMTKSLFSIFRIRRIYSSLNR